jgi:hypothetical protein
VNIPGADPARSKAFFSTLGFSYHPTLVPTARRKPPSSCPTGCPKLERAARGRCTSSNEV